MAGHDKPCSISALAVDGALTLTTSRVSEADSLADSTALFKQCVKLASPLPIRLLLKISLDLLTQLHTTSFINLHNIKIFYLECAVIEIKSTEVLKNVIFNFYSSYFWYSAVLSSLVWIFVT